MRSIKAGPGTLLVLATAAVLVLMALSEFQPAPLNGLRELDMEEPGEVMAIVVRCRPCSGGFLLNLTDGEGGWADAFCSQDLCSNALSNGTSVRVTVQRSSDDREFLYVQKLTVLSVPAGKS
jgi:hypothetical protein